MAERKPFSLDPKDLAQSFAQADLAPVTFNPETRTVKFQWLSRTDHPRVNFLGQRYILRLHPEGCDLSRVNSGGPLKFFHETRGQDTIIGNVLPKSMMLSADAQGFGEARLIEFAADESDTLPDRRAAMKFAKGYIRPVSFDGNLDEFSVEEFDDGSIPVVHGMKWSVGAMSVVTIGQDPAALTMEAQHMSTKHAPDGQQVEPPVAPDPAALEAAKQEGLAAGSTAAFARLDECRELGVVFGLDDKAVLEMAKGSEPVADIGKRLIREKAKAGAALGVRSDIRMGADERDTLKMAVLGGIEAYLGKTAPTGPAVRFAGASLEGLARAYLQGMRFGDVTFDPITAPTHMVVRRALGFGQYGALAPTDLPVLLVQGTQRVLDRIAGEAPSMDWLSLCKVRALNDLREIQIVSRKFAGTVQEIPVNGPVEKPFTHAEGYEVGAVKQWGGRDDIGRAAQINDDLGALDDLPQDIFSAFQEHMTDRFWSVFLTGTLRDTKTVCHADHLNVVASGGAGPGTIAQLAKMRLLFKKALHGEKKLRLRMTHLIVPEALRDEAWQVVSGNITPTETAKTVPADYRGLKVISDTALDDSSAVIWYAAAEAFKCFHYLTLRGVDTPQITQKLDDDTRALQIRAFKDYNIVAGGYQGVARNKGAA